MTSSNEHRTQDDELLRRLTEHCRDEAVPPIDVSRQVVGRLARLPLPLVGRSTLVMAAAACLLSVAALATWLLVAAPDPEPAAQPTLAELLLNNGGADPIFKVLAP